MFYLLQSITSYHGSFTYQQYLPQQQEEDEENVEDDNEKYNILISTVTIYYTNEILFNE